MKNKPTSLNKIYLNFAILIHTVLFAFNIFPPKEIIVYLKNTNALETSNISYAKALSNCILYKSATVSNNLKDIYFHIPETYFVSILSQPSDNLYKVKYYDYVGYCEVDKLTIANFIPSNPVLLDITFNISPLAGTQIWSSPTDQSSVLTTITADTKEITYIACTIGEIPIGGNSNLWYYARFTPASNTTSVYEGYVYSEATTNLSHIPNNLEYNSDNEILSPDLTKTISLNQTLQVVMIILICLPFVALFIIACIKARIQIKKSLPIKSVDATEISTEPKTTFANKKFTRKAKPIIVSDELNEDELEIVFPEYNFIDDDELL